MKFTDANILPAGLERSLRFYVTNPSPCPYLPGKRERKAFTNLAVSDADSIHNSLSQAAIARNASLVRTPVQATATREQFRLLREYVTTRHDKGGMSEMTYRDYVTMVGGSPVQSLIFEYRDGTDDDAPLVAVSITDVLRDGFSMVYTFFDPELDARGLGHFMILDHIQHAQDLGLPHVYLGYWVKGSPKMDYKRRYKPLEVLDGDQWRTLRDDE